VELNEFGQTKKEARAKSLLDEASKLAKDCVFESDYDGEVNLDLTFIEDGYKITISVEEI
jgi:hypothetical protein